MKFYFTLIFSLFLIITANAQLKTIDFGNASASSASNTIINVPLSKQNLSRNTQTTGYSPKSLTFRQDAVNGLEVTARNNAGLPIFIEGKPELSLRNTATQEDRAYNFLMNAKDLMKIDNPEAEFVIINSVEDAIGMTHVKMQQVHNGTPIYGAEVIYHESEKSTFLNGRFYQTVDQISAERSINEAEAKSIVVESVGGLAEIGEDKYDIFDFDRVATDLVYYVIDNELRLAYHSTVYKNLIDRREMFVDAVSGEVLDSHSSLCKFHNHKSEEKCNHNHDVVVEEHTDLMPPPNGPFTSNATDLFGNSVSINGYEINNEFYMIDASRTMFNSSLSNLPNDPVGTVWTIDAFDTSPENNNFQYDHVKSTSQSFNGKNTGVSAQYNGGQAYMYFKNIHNRESINGQGGNVIGLVNVADSDGSSLGNAFWNGQAMFYGNGDNSFKPLARGLDVAGHEMSHGVIQATANLEYRNESGALNESFADVFGAMIDRDDWLIGEDVVNAGVFPGGALRSLQDPHNGASNGNFNQGWQPKKYSERYTGTQDNGGVHYNSGIPNHAFYLFASNSNVGRAKAEKVYYRALTQYMTKSSQFIDARLAVVQAADDLYDNSVVNAAKSAFDQVEIFNGNGTTTQTDVNVNPGSDLILFTTADQNSLYIANEAGELIFNPLTEEDPISVPSVTDDGSEIIFVNADKELYYIRIDWTSQSIAEEGVIASNNAWRNAVFSKDGLRLAALTDVENNEIFVYDFVTSAGLDYELFNPTFTEGVSTGDVLFADALEFDFTGEYLLYDAFNRIEGVGGDIEYWDIGFIKVFDNNSGTFTTGNDISKLFTQLPDGVSVGNPTFSKNSDYILAFDYLEGNEFRVLGANIETGDVGTIYEDNDRPGYPSHSLDDNKVIFDAITTQGNEVIGGADLQSNKIDAISGSAAIQLSFENVGVKWGVWFGNGDRVLSSSDDVTIIDDGFDIYPNPANQSIEVSISNDLDADGIMSIFDMMGKVIYTQKYEKGASKVNIDLTSLTTGQYILNLSTSNSSSNKLFIKQ